MRLIVLSGHQRPIRKVQMNRDDDLLFTAASDGNICVWDPETGERLGIYHGPKFGGKAAGMVSDIDIDFNTKYLLSGSGDETIRLWDIASGKISWKTKIPTRVSSVSFSCGDKLMCSSNPYFRSGSQDACVRIFKNPFKNNDSISNKDKDDGNNNKWISEIKVKKPKELKTFNIAKARWSPLNNYIYIVCSDGTIRVIDVNKSKVISKMIFDKHVDELTDIKIAKDYCRALVTSRNFKAKIYDIRKSKWNILQEFKTNRGLNSCAFHPKLNCCVLGGGKTAQQAALDKKNGNYEILLYNSIYNIEMGRIETDCFSPINSMTFNSDGTQFILGYEEGQVRIFSMNVDFDTKYQKNEKRYSKFNKNNDEFSDDDSD